MKIILFLLTLILSQVVFANNPPHSCITRHEVDYGVVDQTVSPRCHWGSVSCQDANANGRRGEASFIVKKTSVKILVIENTCTREILVSKEIETVNKEIKRFHSACVARGAEVYDRVALIQNCEYQRRLEL